MFTPFFGAPEGRPSAYGRGTTPASMRVHRLRFLLDTVDALAEAIGAQRVGVRISPFGRLNDMRAFDDEAQTWLTAANELSKRNLAYIHLSDQCTIGGSPVGDFLQAFRDAYRGTLIAAGGFDKPRAEQALQRGVLGKVCAMRFECADAA